MTKWADYCIFAVRFNPRHTHIDRVQAYPDKGESLGSPVEFARADVVANIKAGTTFVTIFKNTDGKWKLGSRVLVINIRGTDYIKTKNDATEADNLDNLPEF